MKDKNGKHILFCVMGRTASGKDTMVREACRYFGLHPVISYATRPQREGEPNTSHFFITKEEMNRINMEEVVAMTQIGEYYYFTTESLLDNSDFYIIDPIGFKQLAGSSKVCDKYCLIGIYLNISSECQKQHSTMRGDNIEVFKKRCIAEDPQFTGFEAECSPDYTIYVRDLDSTCKEFFDIIRQYICAQQD